MRPASSITAGLEGQEKLGSHACWWKQHRRLEPHRPLTSQILPTSFATDDKLAGDLADEGHLDHSIRRDCAAASRSRNQMGSINTRGTRL
jgi:hypothetical protein